MTEKIRELNNKFVIVANQIDYQIFQFEVKSLIEERQTVLIELNKLLTKSEEYMIKVEEEFNISSTYIKMEFKEKVKKNLERLNKFKSEVHKCFVLLSHLKDKENSNLNVSTKINELPDIGDFNFQSLGYSQTITIKNNAKKTFDDTKEYLRSLEMEMKTTPLIDQDDPAYEHYLKYNEIKKEMLKNKKSNIFRIFICVVILLVFIFTISYLIIYKSNGGDVIVLEEEDYENFKKPNNTTIGEYNS